MGTATPYAVPREQVITLFPRTGRVMDKENKEIEIELPGLLLSDSEFEEMMIKFCKGVFQISQYTITHIRNLTGGHVGLLKRILPSFLSSFLSSFLPSNQHY